MRTWYLFIICLLLIQLVVWTFLPTAPPAFGGRLAATPLQYGEFCYWEKGLAKLRDAQATASINLVPLGDQHE